jgi:hypothetical protein
MVMALLIEDGTLGRSPLRICKISPIQGDRMGQSSFLLAAMRSRRLRLILGIIAVIVLLIPFVMIVIGSWHFL